MINLVIEDYVASLKEKDELDVLLPNLLKLKGYSIKNLPRTGERQFGVDLLAEKNDELFLYVIKQGDLTRNSWDNEVNAVRQSIDEIFDVYLSTMVDPIYINKQKNIVFVTNGLIRDAVRPNWEGYKKRHTTNLIKFDTILLPDLVKMVSNFGFNETLFSIEMHSNLRKCLYYLDETDYQTTYFKLIINEYFKELLNTQNEKKERRIFNSMWMLINLVNSYAFEKGRYRVCVEFSEVALFSMWKYMKKKKAFEKELETEWLYKLINNYSKTNERFLDNLIEFIDLPQGIPAHNSLEHRLLCFDILGILTVYGLFLCGAEKLFRQIKYSSKSITNIIIQLLNNNSGFFYPLYDNDGIEISMLLLLLKRQNRSEDLANILNGYIAHITSMIENKKYPVLERRFSLVLDVEFGDIDYMQRYKSSFLWGIIKEWTVLTEQKELSEFISETELLKDVDIQNWNCKSLDEEGLFNVSEAHNQGYTSSYNKLEDKDLIDLFNDKDDFEDFLKFSFNKYSFPTIGLIISRLHRLPVIPSYWRIEFSKYHN
ncbi:hypothetical protein [Sediminibacillus albus]|uniref:Uncharacterized protein n=1 Tax=Sediminibacillus albus TaxID=407036 RepID=A0A1G9A497_9BACI|nr:hypothetical protein [Sediminibacillus albus]SDK22143.1 hypothetical protein SAMN05216243_2404 [Sediminibacillus albus]